MDREPQTVRLGAQSWRVRPLTLAQVRDIEPILVAQGAGGTVAAAMEVVAIALSRDNPAAVDGLPSMEATAPEVAAALAVVLRLGGFIAPNAGSGGSSGGRDGRGVRLNVDDVVARIVTACGLAPDVVAEMSVVDALALFSYWRRHPPGHEILQAAFGPPQVSASATPDDPSGIADLLARHPDGVVRAG